MDSSGQVQEVYQPLTYDYDTGAGTTANLALNWDVTDNFTLVPEFRYISETQLYFPEEGVTRKGDDVCLIDIYLKIRNIFPFDLDFYVKNVADEGFRIPGAYTFFRGDGFSAGVMAKIRW